ncbi:MAG: hypothetical protein AAGE52_34985 [Myxococcota bacterium]
MNRIAVVALNTFREALRDRVLYAVIGLAFAVLFFTLALAELSLDQQERVVRNLGLASISLFSVVVAIFLGSSLLYKEIERKTLYVILPKPIHRWEFLLGKYAGIVGTGIIFVMVMGAVQILVMSLQRGAPVILVGGLLLLLVLLAAVGARFVRDRTSLWFPLVILGFVGASLIAMQGDVAVEPIVATLVLYVGELSILTAVALFFSSFSTPFTTGGLTFGVWLVGRSADAMQTMRSSLLTDEVKALLRGVARVVPNFNLFVPSSQTTASEPWGYVSSAMTYGVVYTAILLILAALIFRRRDFI